MPFRFYPQFTANDAPLLAHDGVLVAYLDDLGGRMAWEAFQGRYQLKMPHAYVADLSLIEREAMVARIEANGFRCVWTDDHLIISWE